MPLIELTIWETGKRREVDPRTITELLPWPAISGTWVQINGGGVLGQSFNATESIRQVKALIADAERRT